MLEDVRPTEMKRKRGEPHRSQAQQMTCSFASQLLDGMMEGKDDAVVR